MQVKDIIQYIAYGDLRSQALVLNLREGSPDERKDAVMTLLTYINFALQFFYTKYDLETDVEVIPPNNLLIAKITNPNYLMPLSITDVNGVPLKAASTQYTDWDYRELSHGKWLFSKPITEPIIVTYTAGATPVKSEEDTIPLPSAFTEALVNYISMRAYNGIGNQNKQDQNIYTQRFQECLQLLDQLGYGSLRPSLAKNTIKEGFV